jgi:hypothetical protein
MLLAIFVISVMLEMLARVLISPEVMLSYPGGH